MAISPAGLRRRARPARSFVVGLGLLAGLAAGVAAVLTGSYEFAGAAFVVALLAVPSLVLLVRVVRAEHDPWMRRLLVLAFAAKMLSSLGRYVVVSGVYGTGDSFAYARDGAELADAFRRGDLLTTLGDFFANTRFGTRFIEILTGMLFTVTGATRLGAFLVFSFAGFWGLYLCYRAFCLALPEGNRRRYGAMVLLFPSLLFWPSSLGKEAWMMLALGLSAYGAARLFRQMRGAYVWLALGLGAATLVRPHIALALAVAVTGAYVLRARRAGAGRSLPLARVAGTIALFGLCVVALRTVETRFADQVGGEGVQGLLEYASTQTAKGGSEFEAVGTPSPLDIPAAAVAVLFRPFPWESANVLAFLASLEGTFLLVMLFRNRRALVSALRARSPYVVFAALYALLFVIAFSSIGNFGILARQRVQVLPFLLVLLSATAVERAAPRGRRRAAGSASEQLDVAHGERPAF